MNSNEVNACDLSFVQQKVTTDMNASLDHPYSADEILQAVMMMYPSKAPGLDGLPPMFYQKYWPIVGQDVVQLVLSILQGGDMPEGFNHTYICLIPKVKDPKYISQYCPISMCNVIGKVATKVLANKLKTILGEIIDEAQSAFVPGRIITDNILCAFEVFHHMKTRGRRNKKLMSLKLDMAKAEGLTGLINDALSRNLLHGIQICRGAPVICNLLFADDCILFMRASLQEASIIKSVLQRYKFISNQKVNLNKSEVSFSSNMVENLKSALTTFLGVKVVSQHALYLGLPTAVGRSKSLVFSNIKDRFCLICYNVWFWRNKKLHDNTDFCPQRVLSAAKHMRAELLILQSPVCAPSSGNSSHHPSRWSPPPVGFVKMNSDATFMGDGWVGFGIVFRDNEGVVLACASKVSIGSWDSYTSECLALVYGLQLAKDLCFLNVIAESDCKLVVDRLMDGSRLRTGLGKALTACMSLKNDLQSCLWSFVPRGCNFVAHALAKDCLE
ncbi:hypothetical protein Cni_G19962 [Canna indica]|uniref:RNase H type-1 domain-containing protein n=1 Tax=Canna indica TaxID=4628 RepID=A0AAQ3KMB7_9LILI|nr:hypothetical protein Cni_G19962 [Canna indica]